ncbi:MAG TPA: hypothetical protein VMW36_05255 [Patescibacteria group bacterium]|nr:hypothetical protein [Patescibacteria group bacterium]
MKIKVSELEPWLDCWKEYIYHHCWSEHNWYEVYFGDEVFDNWLKGLFELGVSFEILSTDDSFEFPGREIGDEHLVVWIDCVKE